MASALRLVLRLAVAVALLAACDREPSAAELLAAHPPPPAMLPRALGDASDPGPLSVASDPPPPPGDLKGDIDAFTTLDDCVRSHARIDPLIGDAVEAIGYDTLVRDACTVIQAAKAVDARRCGAIDVSALHDRCIATVAELAEKPDACPWLNPDRPLLGREPACVAIALRDPSLCAGAAEQVDRATCTAVAGHDVGACAKLEGYSVRVRCERAAERWRTAVASAAPKKAAAPAGELHLETLSGGPGVDVDFTRELTRGLVVQEQHLGARLAFGPARGDTPDRLAPPDDRHDEVSLELLVPPPDPTKKELRSVRIERFDAVVQGVAHSILGAPRTVGAGDARLSVKVTSFERVRGGRIDLSIEGTFGDDTRASKGRVRVATFVRDIVGSADVFGLPSAFTPQRSAPNRAVALDAGSAQP